jgi:uncharacterized integral membrane protein (TIGR00698 family)
MGGIDTMSLCYPAWSDNLRALMNQLQSTADIPAILEPEPETRNSTVPVSVKDALFLCMVCLLIWRGSLGLALVAGMIFALTLGHPHRKAGSMISKWLFQGCVILLGFGMDLEKVLKAGTSGFLFAAVSIASTLAIGFCIGHFLGIGKKTSALIASGTAICGGSAIAAVGPVIAATEAEMGIAVGAIFLLNAAALFIFPAIGTALHLTQHQFGIWAGIGIHDISSVVGAASTYGYDALQTATAVKLSRALWIVPLTVGMGAFLSARHTPQHSKHASSQKRKIAIPWFIGFFLLASVLRSYCPAVAHFSGLAGTVAKAGMCIALCLIGASLSPKVLRTLGWKVAAQAGLLWLFIGTLALVIAVTLG